MNDRFPNFPDASSESFEWDDDVIEELKLQRLKEYYKKPRTNYLDALRKSRVETPKRKRESVYTIDDQKEDKLYEISTSKSIVSRKRTVSEHIVIYSD